MKLNEDKCHLMVFGESTNEELSINIGSCAVSNSKEEKLLGVLIDTSLSFEKHISNICQKASNKLFALSRMSASLGTDKLCICSQPIPILSFGLDVSWQKNEQQNQQAARESPENSI